LSKITLLNEFLRFVYILDVYIPNIQYIKLKMISFTSLLLTYSLGYIYGRAFSDLF